MVPDVRYLIVPLVCLYLAGCAPDSGVPGMMDEYVMGVADALELRPEFSDIAFPFTDASCSTWSAKGTQSWGG